MPRSPRRGRGRLLASLIAAALLLAGCGSEAAASVDPASPCNGADQQHAPGFYPALESALPGAVGTAAPESVESGRFCSAASLGTLLDRGLQELHFAGAIWPTGDQEGISLVVYQGPGLTTDLLADAFTAGAAKASAVAQISTEAITVAGRKGVRIRVNNQDKLQTVVFWPAAAADTVNAVLAADPDAAHLQAAVDAFGSR